VARTSPTIALILFAHGARAQIWAQPLHRLKEEMARIRPDARVEIAFLEIQDPDLMQALLMMVKDGLFEIDIAPVFWSAGGHILQDLPSLIGKFQEIHPDVRIRVLPVLSELPGMSHFVASTILANISTAPQLSV